MLLLHALLPSLIIFLLSLIGIQVAGTASYVVSAFSFYGVAIPLFFLLTKKEKAALPEKHSMSPEELLMAFIVCFPFLYLGNYLGMFLNFLLSGFQSASASPVDEATSTLGLGFTFLFIVILAPIFEELVFRKLLLDRIGKYGCAPAIALSGLSFGLFHGNFLQFFYALFLGFFFAFLYLRTGKLRYTVFLHILINFFGSIVPMLLNEWTGIGNSPAGAEIEIAPAPLFLLLLYSLWIIAMNIAGIVLLIAGRKKFSLPSLPGEIEPGNEQKLLFSPGVLLFLLFCVLFFLLFLL